MYADIPRGNGEVALLVDDDAATLYCVGDMLCRLGYAVIKEDNARSALEIISNGKGAVHIVITDYRMPGMSGLELVHAMRSVGGECPAVLISGYGDMDAYLTASSTNDILFLRKPVGVRDLAVAVRHALCSRSSRHSESPRQQRSA